MFLTIITFILVLSLLVFVHELGHFWVARRFGLKPREFGFGFPPRAIGYYKNKEGKWKTVRGSKDPEDANDTIYSVNWLPLGGFVDLGEDERAEENENHFSNKPIWQRFFILIAGVTMNIILAAFLISFGYMYGLPQATEGLDEGVKVRDEKVQVQSVLEGSPADIAGLEVADTVVAVNGESIKNNEQLAKLANENVGNEMVYTIRRVDEEFDVSVTPELMEETGKGGVGIGIVETGIVRYPVHIALWEGIKSTLLYTWIILVAFFDLISGLILGKGVSIEVGGPIRIAEITGDNVRMGFSYLLNFSALLSINLAIINAFPFPALDGGRIIFLIAEKIKGRPVSKNIEAAIHRLGFAFLMVLIILVTWQDIARLFR